MSENQKTLQAYESGVDNYINATAHNTSGVVKSWIDAILTLLSPTASILEIGSAFGRDAKYIESQGFIVQRTDAAKSFLEYLHNFGYAAYHFNILTDPFTAHYDLIFANAVLLHFTPDELKSILQKIHMHLRPNGLLAFSMKVGLAKNGLQLKLETLAIFATGNLTNYGHYYMILTLLS
jgi:2-polyprenyl-3-methyl-5-hydroxy-6-metoxy-1,4-benzoquinol methylase